MSNSGWPHSESPFHEGELSLQAQVGAQARIDTQGRRMIRPYLIAQHRQFFAALPYVILGSVDDAGAPWASILTGSPGFLLTPDEHTLRIVTSHLSAGAPLSVAVGDDVGVLGIELKTRRRNRINGTVSRMHSDGFEVHVQQSFGNCPQYIQSRQVISSEPGDSVSAVVSECSVFSEADKALIASADTFFIATAYQAKSAGRSSGVDVSHRGGHPGFVVIEGDRTLTIPDFSGNNHFNTLGNILLNPHAGLLFIDFDTGTLLHLTGTADVIVEGEGIAAYAGAQRLLRFRLARGYRIESALSLQWSLPEFSPFL
ncbi:MAG: pyridoxamine 5'-phosphate oxidase family protein [Cyanobacteria bacterium J06634_5]